MRLVVLGALSWGLGMFRTGPSAIDSWNLVDLLLGWSPLLEALVYLLVGPPGLYELYFALPALRRPRGPQRANSRGLSGAVPTAGTGTFDRRRPPSPRGR